MSEYPVSPRYLADADQHRRLIAENVARMMQGKTNNAGTVTLTASAASTTISDDRIGYDSVVIFVPVTANAAAEIYGGTMYYANTSRTNGALTINHANNSQTDRTFQWVVIG